MSVGSRSLCVAAIMAGSLVLTAPPALAVDGGAGTTPISTIVTNTTQLSVPTWDFVHQLTDVSSGVPIVFNFAATAASEDGTFGCAGGEEAHSNGQYNNNGVANGQWVLRSAVECGVNTPQASMGELYTAVTLERVQDGRSWTVESPVCHYSDSTPCTKSDSTLRTSTCNACNGDWYVDWHGEMEAPPGGRWTSWSDDCYTLYNGTWLMCSFRAFAGHI
jgi:hypothetical protein